MIDTFFTILKKCMVAVVFVLFGFATVYTPIPHHDGGYSNVEEAYAGGVFLDPVNLVQNTITAVQSAATYVIQSWLYLKENVLDGIAWAIAKQFLSNLVSDVVNWINSGFRGSPAFVQDLDNFLLRSADEAIGEYINNLGGAGSFVCQPFRLDVQLAVAINWELDREDRQVECTLSDIFDNFEEFGEFIDGDFRAGGWEGWFDIVNRPGHTPYGSILTAQAEGQARVLNAKRTETTLLSFGNGFLSLEDCSGAGGGGGSIDLCFITNPGIVFEKQINKALGANQDSLVAADEFNEILVALLGQVTSQLVSGADGILGLSGDGGSYNPYVPAEYSPALEAQIAAGTCNPSTGDGCTAVGGSGGAGSAGTVGGGTTGNNSGLEFIRNTLADQQTILTSIDNYITSLDSFSRNSLNEDTDRLTAEILYDEAVGVRDRVLSGYTLGEPLLNDYLAEEAAYNATTDPDERAAIRTRQAVIIQDFSALGLMTEREYDIYTSRWEQLLAQGVYFDPTNPITIPIGPINL